MCFGMILPKVILESQDILVSSSEGPQDGFFSFSSGGYLVGGVRQLNFHFQFSNCFESLCNHGHNLPQFVIRTPLAFRLE